jgi:hypothetical protein
MGSNPKKMGLEAGASLRAYAVDTQTHHILGRHARPCAGHPRIKAKVISKTWMAGTSPAMTDGRKARIVSLCFNRISIE